PARAELSEREIAGCPGRLGRVAVAPVGPPDRVADLELLRPLGIRPRRLPGLGIPEDQADAADHQVVLLADRRVETEAVGLPPFDPPAEIPRHRVGPALLRLGPGRGERSVLFVQRELVDVLVLDVLQVLLAEVAHADALGEIVADERTGRLGGEDLPAVAGRADACRPDDVQADVSLLADGRLARVQAHPHADLGPAGPRVL